MKPSRLKTTLVASAVLCVAQGAVAADRHWIANSGLWTVASDWSPNGVPQPADNVFVDHLSGGLGGSVRIHNAAGAVTSLTVLNGGTVSMYDSHSDTMGSITVGSDFVLGKNSTGGMLTVLRPSSMVAPGAVTVVNSMRLGSLSGSGFVNQNTGTVGIGGDLYIGDNALPGSEFKAFGRYNISGGTLRVSDGGIWVGHDDDSVGELNISGSANVVTDGISIGGIQPGDRGYGTVNQSGGQLTLNNGMSIGFRWPGLAAANLGTYNLSGGSVAAQLVHVYPTCLFNFTGGSADFGVVDVLAESGADGARLVFSGTAQKTLRADYIVVQPSAVFDLNDGSMTLTSAHLIDLRALIARGYNGGAWNGDGLTSTAARLHPQHLTAIGHVPLNFERLVKYTWYGDANCDGEVDGADYALIDAGFNSQITQGNIGHWYRGDFNYDGKISGADYALIDSSFNAQTGTLRRMLDFLDGTNRDRADMTAASLLTMLAHFDQFGESYALAALSNVPEPALVGALAALAGLQHRRRRP